MRSVDYLNWVFKAYKVYVGELNKLIKEVVFTVIKEGKVKDFLDKSRDFINKTVDTYNELKNRDFKSSSNSKEEFKIKATSSDLRNTDFKAYIGKFPYQAYLNQDKTKVRVSFDPSKVNKAFANRITNRDRKDSFYPNFVSYDNDTAILEFPIKESVMVPTPIPYKGYQCDKQGKLIKDTEEPILDLQTTDDKDILTEDLGHTDNKEEILSAVVEEYGTTDEPYDGPSFILPNGSFLDLNGKVKHHSDVEKFLISKELSAYNSIGDTVGSPTLKYLGCVRVDTPKYYIQLPYDQLTSSQYSSIQNWIDYLTTLNKPYVEVIAPKEGPVKYYFDDEIYAPTYVSERIRRYYMSGKLYESGHSPDDYCRKSNCDKDIVEESILDLDLELSGVKFKNPEISDIIETEDISRNEDSDEVIKSVLTDVKKEISDTDSEEYINKVEDELSKKGISVDADHLGSLMSETVLKESKEILSESTDDGELEEKYLTLRVLDPESTIENLLNHIKTLASSGHSFNVSVDSVNDERHQDFFIDGDGCDKIYSIEVSEKKVVKESKNPFKDNHICDGCDKPLSQCTCEVKEEDLEECTQVSNIGQHKSSSIDIVEGDSSYGLGKDLQIGPGDIIVSKEAGIRYKVLKPLVGYVRVLDTTHNVVNHIRNDYLTSDNFDLIENFD